METNIARFTRIFGIYIIDCSIKTTLEAFELFLTQGKNGELRAREVFTGNAKEKTSPDSDE